MTSREPVPASPRTSGRQEISEVFRGSAGSGSERLSTRGTEHGIEARTIPAFVAGEELAEVADVDDRVVVLTADLASAGRTIDFARRHPQRFFNMGVAEQNMVSVAAGMASTGLRPFVSTFAAYVALLCCEQVRTDLAYPQMPVVMLGHHAGISLGFYGTSHHALEDIGIMRTIAGLTVVCAADANELRAVIRASLDLDGPLYIRMGRGRDPEVYSDVPSGFAFGQAIRLRDGRDITIIATGSEVSPALGAAELLAADGIAARVVDMHTMTPVDTAEIAAAIDDTGVLLTVEEHNVTGGLGAAVAEVVAEMGVPLRFRRAGIPDEHVVLGPPAALYAHYALDAPGIAQRARDLLEEARPRQLPAS